MRERDVVDYCKKVVSELGGEMRKVSWEGRKNAPDWLVMLPTVGVNGFHFYAEFKRPGKGPTEAQWREIIRMRNSGMRVVVFSHPNDVDTMLLK